MEYGKNDGPEGEQMLEEVGLVAGHAYSVIQAHAVSERALGGVKSGDTFHLLQLRNPWGSFEWKGEWSDKSDMWKKHPSIASQLGFKDEEDGTFWMTYNDFRQVFTRINICDRDTSLDASLNVREDDGVCGVCKGFICGCMKFW
eukprot:CAMPEP_0171311200 /NCGR_PEP_ID=MMETSP0816-20121228/21439_1 /TAXON_ID=420281 /ORGANISM="Proboscia inermis, Strain CCAP1064/1" /LENGTH=143 /DNA_ID=CAMNT_0011795823 /DNA_START=30 /DNA_END=458 /DNA_ORIENTATION=+